MSEPKFLFAQVLPGGTLIDLVRLSQLPIGDPILENLGCPRCGSKLVFRHRSGRNRANLASMEPHADDCMYRVQYKIVDTNRRTTNIGIATLTDSEQESRSQTAFYSFVREYEEKHGDTHLIAKRKSRKNSSRKPKRGAPNEIVPIVEGTVGMNADGEFPGVHKHIGSADPLTLTTDKIGRTLKVAGVLEALTIDPTRNYATITISNEGVSVPLIMNEAFFSGASVEYKQRLEDVRNVIQIHKEMLVIPSAVIEVIPGKTRGSFLSMIRSESSVKFNGRSAGMFIHAYGDYPNSKVGK